MIPTPPPDPALPALPAALDGARVAELLAEALAGPEDRGGTILDCRPDYIRYKPGTNALVGYRLHARDAAGRVHALPLHLVLYPGDRAERRAAKPALRALAARAGRPLPGLAPLGHLPALGALAQLYPLDRKLPGLVEASGALAAGAPGPERIRYKPGRKALLRYPLPGGGANYGKLHGYERRPEIRAWTAYLRAAGLPTPAIVGWRPASGLLLQAEAPGRPLKSLRAAPDYLDWMAPAAGLLQRLHAIGAENGPHPSGPEPSAANHAARPLRVLDEAGAAQAAADAIARLRPALAPQVRRLAAGVAAGIAAAPPGRTLVHGDFYDDQIMVSAAGPWLLDLDELGLGRPLGDAANFAAHLALAGLDEARAAFLDAFARRRNFRPRDLAAFEAGALLRLAGGPFRHLRADWPEGIAGIVARAEARLAEGRWAAGRPAEARRAGDRKGRADGGMPSAARLATAAAPLASFAEDPALPQLTARCEDPALPQLNALLDPAHVGPALGARLGLGRVEVRAIEPVRHKPGRRCVLRYRLCAGDQAFTIYGKAFASARGPAVHEVARRIEAGLRGRAELAVPPTLGYLPDWRLLLQGALPGEPIEGAVLAGDLGAAAGLAEALFALHDSDLALGRRHGWEQELAILARQVERLAGAAPELAAPAEDCLAEIRVRTRATRSWRARPLHRDFHPDQVLWDGLRPAFLDFDDAAMGEPALDLANFRAHLGLLALRRAERARAIASFGAAFVARYRALDPALDPDLVALLEAATWLRLAAIHHGRPPIPVAGPLVAACAEGLALPLELSGVPR